MSASYTLNFSQIGMDDLERVGGKNASLGKLFQEFKPLGVGVPDGFATTADAHWRLLAEKVFDGYSIGSNDLTQRTLGVDRDSATVARLFDENDAAVKRLIEDVIGTAQRAGKPIGICGQARSDFPDFAEWLVRLGIDSISLNPDTAVQSALSVARVESKGKVHLKGA